MDYIQLGKEINVDLDGIGYGGMSNQECADSMNAKDRDKKQNVSVSDITAYLRDTVNKWLGISEANVEDSKSNSGKMVLSLADANEFTGGSIDVESIMFTGILDGLVADGKIDAAEKAAVVALGTIQISREAELGLGWVRQGCVEIVRGPGQPREPLKT